MFTGVYRHSAQRARSGFQVPQVLMPCPLYDALRSEEGLSRRVMIATWQSHADGCHVEFYVQRLLSVSAHDERLHLTLYARVYPYGCAMVYERDCLNENTPPAAFIVSARHRRRCHC